MITYDVDLCIGVDAKDNLVTIKNHDTGASIRTRLFICQHGKWLDKLEPYNIPTGSTAVLRIVKPDKKYCITDGTVGSNSVLFELPPQAFTTAGICRAEVSLFGKDGKRITTGSFGISVPEECICGCDLESENYIDVMSEQIIAAIDAAERAEAAVVHGPIIKDGTWWLWDLEAAEYKDSGVRATGSGEGGGGIAFETDPTVPAWAKQQEKPKYTAQEVGALSADSLPTAVNEALAQAKASGEFDGADGEPGQPGADGRTPVKGEDYFTEADKQEIAEQAAQLVDVPEELPNPNALTFTGAVEGSYDGSKPLSIEIPQGGGGGEWVKIAEITLEEPISKVIISNDIDGNPFELNELIIRGLAVSETEVQNGNILINGKPLIGDIPIASSNTYFTPFEISVTTSNGLFDAKCIISPRRNTTPTYNTEAIGYANSGCLGNLPCLPAEKITKLGIDCKNTSFKFGVNSTFIIYGR